MRNLFVMRCKIHITIEVEAIDILSFNNRLFIHLIWNCKDTDDFEVEMKIPKCAFKNPGNETIFILLIIFQPPLRTTALSTVVMLHQLLLPHGRHPFKRTEETFVEDHLSHPNTSCPLATANNPRRFSCMLEWRFIAFVLVAVKNRVSEERWSKITSQHHLRISLCRAIHRLLR